jgi:DNA-binding response OmpR family regulator
LEADRAVARHLRHQCADGYRARRLGFRCHARTRTLDSHACRLRAKLSAAGDRRWIENVWGVGYRLVGVDPDARDGSAA